MTNIKKDHPSPKMNDKPNVHSICTQYLTCNILYNVYIMCKQYVIRLLHNCLHSNWGNVKSHTDAVFYLQPSHKILSRNFTWMLSCLASLIRVTTRGWWPYIYHIAYLLVDIEPSFLGDVRWRWYMMPWVSRAVW